MPTIGVSPKHTSGREGSAAFPKGGGYFSNASFLIGPAAARRPVLYVFVAADEEEPVALGLHDVLVQGELAAGDSGGLRRSGRSDVEVELAPGLVKPVFGQDVRRGAERLVDLDSLP